MLVLLWPFGIFYGHLVNFVAIWYSLWSFGIFFPVLVCLDREKSGNPGLVVSSSPSEIGAKGREIESRSGVGSHVSREKKLWNFFKSSAGLDLFRHWSFFLLKSRNRRKIRLADNNPRFSSFGTPLSTHQPGL
jgi:hypothetical protein